MALMIPRVISNVQNKNTALGAAQQKRNQITANVQAGRAQAGWQDRYQKANQAINRAKVQQSGNGYTYADQGAWTQARYAARDAYNRATDPKEKQRLLVEYNRVRGSKPGEVAATPATATPPADTGTPPTDNTATWGNRMAELLFEDTKAFNDNAAYTQALKRGQSDLQKLMAARGLAGGGAEIQANSDFLAELNAKESNRVNDAVRDRNTRLYQMLQDESLRKEREGNTQFDRQMSVIDRMLSLDPTQEGYNATQSLAGLTQEDANAIASFLGQSGRGGGGAAVPTSPDMSGVDLLRNILKGQNSVGSNSLISRILGGLVS